MTLQEAIRRLSNSGDLLSKYRVKSLSIFGSVARNEAQEGSDIDILVEFSESPGIFDFIRLKQSLEDLLGVPVDLATTASLKKSLRDQILREAVRAA